MLRVLADDPTHVFSKDELMAAVWGLRYPAGGTRTLDSHASRLRKLLADAVDEYAIREVSISTLRWRSTVTWPVERLLAELAPGPPAGLTTLKGERFGTPVDIDSLRADFAGVVRRASQRAPAGLPPVD